MNKDLMRNAGFSKEVESVEKGDCPFCGKKIFKGSFRDAISMREYGISGLCQNCQDEFFCEHC